MPTKIIYFLFITFGYFLRDKKKPSWGLFFEVSHLPERPGELAPMQKMPVAGFHRALIPPPLLISISNMNFQ